MNSVIDKDKLIRLIPFAIAAVLVNKLKFAVSREITISYTDFLTEPETLRGVHPAVSHQRSDPVGKRSTVRAAKYDGTSIRDGNPVDRRAAADHGTSEAVTWISEAILWTNGELVEELRMTRY